MRPRRVPMAGRTRSHSTAADCRTKRKRNSRNSPKRIKGRTTSANAHRRRGLHFRRHTPLAAATLQRLSLPGLKSCDSFRGLYGRMATSERTSDRPCANQGAQRHAREFVVGRLVHEDDRQDRGAAGLVDVRDCGLDRVTRRDDVVDDQDFLALGRGVVRGKGTAFAMPLLAGPVDDELFTQLLTDQCRERNPVDRNADDRIRIHLPFLELLEGDVRHRRGHEPDAVAVHANGPPTDLHVLRCLTALDPARQKPGDGLRREVQLVPDLFLGEALLLVLHGPLRDRVHIFHPFSNSAAYDARRRISRYRADAGSGPEPARSVYNPAFFSRPSSLTL